LQDNSRFGTTTVVYLTKNGLLASDSRDDFQGGGHTSLLLPPGAENPSYATAALTSTRLHDIAKMREAVT